MPPDDPLGRHGPSLDLFLRKGRSLPCPRPLAPCVGAEGAPPACPYGKKCTYGNKCKYYHPERGNLPQKSVTERLAEQARLQLQEVKARGGINSRDSSPGVCQLTRLLSMAGALLRLSRRGTDELFGKFWQFSSECGQFGKVWGS